MKYVNVDWKTSRKLNEKNRDLARRSKREEVIPEEYPEQITQANNSPDFNRQQNQPRRRILPRIKQAA
jgi:hypothetical protein